MPASKSDDLKTIQGFALIELLFTLAIGLWLISLLISIYLSSQRSTSLQAALHEVETNAHIALAILQKDIRKTGYIGCAKLTRDFPLNAYSPYSLTVDNQLILNSPKQITVRFASYPNNILLSAMRNDSYLVMSSRVKFQPDDIVIISDCRKAEIFKIAQIFMHHGEQIIIPDLPLKYFFDKNAEISLFEINTYYVAATKRKQINGQAITALFRKKINGKQEELVDGIDSVQFTLDRFGVAMMLNVSALSIKREWYGYAALYS